MLAVYTAWIGDDAVKKKFNEISIVTLYIYKTKINIDLLKTRLREQVLPRAPRMRFALQMHLSASNDKDKRATSKPQCAAHSLILFRLVGLWQNETHKTMSLSDLFRSRTSIWTPTSWSSLPRHPGRRQTSMRYEIVVDRFCSIIEFGFRSRPTV